ncbi:uncharacterized protein VDAG_09186 [Verticillium dahliae VdLs.17]|uniref:Uncharacterized protein n=1 Tax=Verticillium dahliae (strain VdLs.17 / ATCC MYA-4575 / FGSC 10137) TaxID=498257 RepID=G2XFR2_VERDV|nr:uncharacterized protein VDAG_09186 [Verticillium dahliae VdLs.17]EGY18660.1 hypothetical protein VDAG_09186 [Verticillium dahliae VdLs.17]
MDGGVLYDIGNWIHTSLTPEFDLDTSKKEKSGLFVEDLDLILHYHFVRDEELYTHERLRVQLALILIIAGATATRPDALIGKVLYKHIEFQLFPPAAEGQRPRLGLMWNLEHVKRSAGAPEKKVFGFHEEDTLLHDPVLHTLALAFADDAFLNGFSGPEQIYDLAVPLQSDRLRLLWKKDWAERPIFRTTEGLHMAIDKALTYCKTRGHLIRLGRALGYAKKLEFYDLRRGSGKKLNGMTTPQSSGNPTDSMQRRSLQRSGISPWGTGWGTRPLTRLQRHGDAPTRLTDDQKLEIQDDPKLARYLQKRGRAMENFKLEGYRSYAAAKDTAAGRKYSIYRKKAESLRKTLTARRLDRAIREFHDTIHAKEVDRQIQGTKPDAELLALSETEYELRERAEVARLFSQAADVSNREELHQLRLKLIVALSDLGKRRESPCRRQARQSASGTTSRSAKISVDDRSKPVLRTSSKSTISISKVPKHSTRFKPLDQQQDLHWMPVGARDRGTLHKSYRKGAQGLSAIISCSRVASTKENYLGLVQVYEMLSIRSEAL